MSNLWTMAAVMAVVAGLAAGCDEAPVAPADAADASMVGDGGAMDGAGGGGDMGVMSCTDEQVAACASQNEGSQCRVHSETASCDIPCSESDNCPGETTCGSDGFCTSVCENDEDCNNGDVCEEGACVIPNMGGDGGMMDDPDGGMVDACNNVCAEGTECRDGQCVAVEGLCGGVSCRGGFECVEGECVEIEGDPCENVDCRDGFTCHNGNCVPEDRAPESHETLRACGEGVDVACWAPTPLFSIDFGNPDAISEMGTGNWRIAASGPGNEPIVNGCRWNNELRPQIAANGLYFDRSEAVTCMDSGERSFAAEAFVVTAGVEFSAPAMDGIFEVLVNKQATPDGWNEGDVVNSNLDNFMLGRRGNSAFCKFETMSPIVIDDRETTNPIVWLDLARGGTGLSTEWSCALFPTGMGSTLVLQVAGQQAILRMPGYARPLTGPGGLQIGGPDLVSDHGPDRLRGATVRDVRIGRLQWTPAQ